MSDKQRQFDYDRGFAAGTAECETLRAQLAERAALDKPAKRHQGDPGEVERLRLLVQAGQEVEDHLSKQIDIAEITISGLRAQLAERDALLERALRLLTPNVGRFRGSVGWAVEVDRFVADLSASAPVGDGVHDDTEAVRAALERKP